MVATTLLVEPKFVDGGRELLQMLKKARIQVDAAFWRWDVFFQEWKLALVLPVVDKIGIRKALERVSRVLQTASLDSVLKIQQLSLLLPDSSRTQGFKESLKGFSEQPIYRLRIDDETEMDGYVYFVK